MRKVYKHRAALLRRYRGELSQEQFGTKLGVTPQYISKQEAENQSMPPEKWQEFSEIFSVPKAEIKKAFMDDYEETIAIYFG